MAVVDAVADGTPAILFACSQGGWIVLDAALRHPSRVRALVLIASNVSGAPKAVYPSEIKDLMARLEAADMAGDLDQVNAIEARLWLDGPLASEGRVTGQARRLFLDMNAVALRSPPTGSCHKLAGVAHLPGRDRQADITDLLTEFIERCSGRPGWTA